MFYFFKTNWQIQVDSYKHIDVIMEHLEWILTKA